MKKLTLTLAILLILSLCACVSDDASKDTSDPADATENETSTDTVDDKTDSDSTEDTCYQIPLPDENSDTAAACDYSKFSVKKPGGEKFEVDDDESLIKAINYVIRHTSGEFGEIEVTVCFNEKGCEDLLDSINYTKKEPVYGTDYESGGCDFLLCVEFEKIDVEVLKALTLRDEVKSISIKVMEIALPG